jgi:hypothetical protein
MTKPTKIQDNPSIAELETTMQGMTAISSIVGFLEKLGIRNETISKALSKLPSLAGQTGKLATLPDRFNNKFADRGWIAFESMNAEVMENALIKADAGDMDDAEDLLAAHFTPETIRVFLVRLKSVPQFQIRWPLSQSALDDYAAGRFHACVPVVLSMIDGLVNDIEQTGFFAAQTSLTAWDSIAAHSSGLSKLRDLFNVSRKKTTDEKITLPYRNGILHGRDLGYANSLVAAKCWAALIAVGDWAFAIRAGKKHPQPKPPEPSFIETLQSLARTEELKQQIEKWSPRHTTAGVDYPTSGAPDDYPANTPERSVASFMEYWKKRNYGSMAKMLKSSGSAPIGKRAGEARSDFGDKELVGFAIQNVRDVAPAACEIDVTVDFCLESTNRTETLELRLLYEDANGDPHVFPFGGGTWVILPQRFSPVIYAV